VRSRTVLLIQPPANLAGTQPCLDDTQYGLGLLALSSWLKQHGYEPLGIHIPLAARQGSTIKQLVELICAQNPLVVAIGLNWVHFSEGAVSLARLIKTAAPSIPVVLGGQHASLFATEIATRHGDAIDGVIVGEAELPLLEICESLVHDGVIGPAVCGFARPDGTASAPRVPDLQSLPTYSYRALWPRPLDTGVGALSTVRGACPFRCSWCIEPAIGRVQGRPKLTFHSEERIADQIERLTGEGIDRFTIQDAFFVGSDRKLTRLAEVLRARKLRPKHLNVFAHPDSFTADGFRALASCCERASVDFGVETGSPAVASLSHRELDPDSVVTAIRAANEAGVEPYTWWMVGLPGEDAKALEETKQLICRTMDAGGVPRWVSPLILFPKTAIHDRPEDFGVSVKFRTFEDYSRFSRTSLAQAVLFNEVLTHSTACQTEDEIGDASKRLRAFIGEHFDRLTSFYAGASRTPDLAFARGRIASSFL
jgi:radical SAM superfamily enzyme YgiQ (UPF0313 family)